MDRIGLSPIGMQPTATASNTPRWLECRDGEAIASAPQQILVQVSNPDASPWGNRGDGHRPSHPENIVEMGIGGVPVSIRVQVIHDPEFQITTQGR